MFDALRKSSRLETRAVVIELRDGRRLRGNLQLSKHETADTLLRRAGPFLTIRTPKGDVAINRDNIGALLLGEDAIEKALSRPAQSTNRTSAPASPRPSRAFDPCRVLGVRPTASREEIKAAWRSRIAECHPDRVRTIGASADQIAAAHRQAAQVNAAYQALILRKNNSAA